MRATYCPRSEERVTLWSIVSSGGDDDEDDNAVDYKPDDSGDNYANDDDDAYPDDDNKNDNDSDIDWPSRPCRPSQSQGWSLEPCLRVAGT